MTLVYRAVWDDDWAEPLTLLNDEFKIWCSSKGIDPSNIPMRGRFDQSDRVWLEVRRADAEFGRALQAKLSESEPSGRTWTTTATALSDPGTSALWVDLECDDPTGGRPAMAAPRLVRALIENGGRPTNFGNPLRTDAVRLHTDVSGLVDTLLEPERAVPIVVFSPDRAEGPEVSLERADTAAAALAGLVQVYALSPQAEGLLDTALPHTFRVFGGAVRMYLPGLHVDESDDAYRHRWIPRRVIAEQPRRAASILAGRLVRLQIHPPIPAAWERLSNLLRRPSDIEVGSRAAQITRDRATANGRPDDLALQAEINDLTRLLAEADLIRESFERDAKRRIAQLEDAVAIAESERYDDADEMETLRSERFALLRVVRQLTQPVGPEPETSTADIETLGEPESIGAAIDLARAYLNHLVIPVSALRNVDELEDTPKYAVWASTTWQGLRALNEYARLKGSGKRPAGLYTWCDQENYWPTSKLAMKESDTVQNNAYLREQRVFEVSHEVDESGRTLMLAHLKIQLGGGNNIPRVYFYDDTDGATAKIHIGFIGPHHLVQNTRS